MESAVRRARCTRESVEDADEAAALGDPGGDRLVERTPAYPNARETTGGLKPGVVRASPSARSNHAVGTPASYAEASGHACAEADSLRVAAIATKPTADEAAR